MRASITNSSKIAAFRREVWRYWKAHGRHDLPWRQTCDPYRILVSEVMLQQTQVLRVIPKYEEFLKTFPSVGVLAGASFSNVLKMWSGLGYNRRAKYLHDAARIIVAAHEKGSNNNSTIVELKLPGMGPYTRSAVRVFAFNEPDVLMETNIRTALIHHFFSGERGKISDKDLMVLARKAAAGRHPRQWHWALMDYGARLKRSGVRTNSRSVHYVKQSKFEGSLRQVRGAILRELQKQRPKLSSLPFKKRDLAAALASLARDGLVSRRGGVWRIV